MRPALGGATPAQPGTEPDAAQPVLNGRRRVPATVFALASDKRLARRAAAGDPDAFAAIFRRYHQDLHRFCVGILREPQDAEDAVQNTMIRAMRALPGERREMQLKPWLYRIAHNEAVELRRRERPVEQLTPTIDDGAATEDVAERDAKLQSMLADIADLPERQRAALVMREVNGLGFGEIGDALGTSPGAVRQALYEARRGLSQMELGRDMDCESAMRQVSDAEGLPRRRGVRAHLRGCARCRRFQAEIRGRKGSLAAISPLPGLAFAGLLKGALGGSAAGAGSAGGALVGAGASGVGAGTAAGGGAGFLAGSGAVKAGVGLLAAIAVGAATVDHDALLRNAGFGAAGTGQRQAIARDGDPGRAGAAVRPGAAGRDLGAAHVAVDRDHARRAAGRQASADRRPAPVVGVETTAVATSAVADETSSPKDVGTSKTLAAARTVGTAPVEQPVTGAPVGYSTIAAPAEQVAAAEHVVASGGGEGVVGSNGNGGSSHVASTTEETTQSPDPPAGAEPIPQAEPATPQDQPARPEQAEHPEAPAQPEASASPTAETPAAEAPAPAEETPPGDLTEPLPETATPAVAAPKRGGGNGKGPAKGLAKQAEEGE